METRQEQAKKARDNIIQEILNQATIYKAGDTEPVGGLLLETKVEDAAKACLDRLFPQFHLADSPAADWKKVLERAKKYGDALETVGHKGDPTSHPVCKAVIAYVGS